MSCHVFERNLLFSSTTENKSYTIYSVTNAVQAQLEHITFLKKDICAHLQEYSVFLVHISYFTVSHM